MAFQPGEGGRPKGARNKRSQEFIAVLAKHDFCAASALIDCYKQAKKIFDNYGLIYDAISEAREVKGIPYPLEDKAHQYLKIAADIAKEIASYAHPKLKSFELEGGSATDDMTDEERLAALERATVLLRERLRGS